MKSFTVSPRSARRACIAFASLVLLTLTALGRAADGPSRMEEIVQKHVGAQQFTGAVLVAKSGAAVFDRAYGLANREWEIPNTPATHFRIGSITKQFTAVAILLLEERGLLKLADPVSTHMRNAPATWSNITLHHLLTHMSGLPNVTNDPEFFLWKSQPATALVMISRFRDLPLDFAPGSRHAYSNSNYLVLGHLVEKLTGQRFGDFLRENVLTPLGLKDSGIDSNERILPRRASGYVRNGDEFQNASYSHMSVPHAAGAMYSTTHDLWRWSQAVFGDKLLSPASRAKLLTPAENGYALGVSRDDAARFLSVYVEQAIYPRDPFVSLDIDGVGQLVSLAAERGRAARPEIKLGICGEHGGDPASIAFCESIGLDYVSASPYRVPIARLSAAQASLREMQST